MVNMIMKIKQIESALGKKKAKEILLDYQFGKVKNLADLLVYYGFKKTGLNGGRPRK